MTDFDRLTWDEAMRRGHAALVASEGLGLYEELNASEGRSNIDIEKHLRRSEVKATQQVWPALARELLAALGLAEGGGAEEREAGGSDVKQWQAQMAYRGWWVEGGRDPRSGQR